VKVVDREFFVKNEWGGVPSSGGGTTEEGGGTGEPGEDPLG